VLACGEMHGLKQHSRRNVANGGFYSGGGDQEMTGSEEKSNLPQKCKEHYNSSENPFSKTADISNDNQENISINIAPNKSLGMASNSF